MYLDRRCERAEFNHFNLQLGDCLSKSPSEADRPGHLTLHQCDVFVRSSAVCTAHKHHHQNNNIKISIHVPIFSREHSRQIFILQNPVSTKLLTWNINLNDPSTTS
jgi:hypothetical protein